MKTRILPHLLRALLMLTPFSAVSAAWNVIPADGETKEVRVWDPAPELKLEFHWSGDINAKHEAEGEGELTWTKPGEDFAMMSTYSGMMKAGKRDGKGVWLHQSGSKYDGEWQSNLKQGTGEYWLGDGGYYKGEFQNDQMHGKGLWIGTDGMIYDGTFVAGKKDGNAKLTLPDGTTRDSIWKADKEVNAPPTPAALKPNIQLALDRTKYAFKGEIAEQSEGSTSINYVGRPVDGAFVIEPDWPVWTTWNRSGPIGSSDSASADFETSMFPVYLEVRVFNPGKTPLAIVSAEVEGEESHPDLEPLLDIGDASSHSGGIRCGVANFKSTKVDSCEISYNIQPEKETPRFSDYKFRETLPPFETTAEFSLEKAVDSLGIDSKAIQAIDDFERANSAASGGGDYEKLAAAQAVIKEKVLKGLGDFAKHASTVDGSLNLRVRVAGEMKVGWKDHLGNPASRTVKFDFKKSLCCLWPEFGAAGPSAGKFDINLPVSAKNYSKPFAFRKTVKPNGSERFNLRLVSDASTRHAFRVRITTADGSKIVSPPCKMTYLVPAGFSWKKGFVVEGSE